MPFNNEAKMTQSNTHILKYVLFFFFSPISSFNLDGADDDDDDGPYQGKFIGTLNSFHHQVM